MKMCDTVTQVGLDVHRKFSSASLRDATGKVIARERLDHVDRQKLRERIAQWPHQTPVILEATFGWGWLSDELQALNMQPHLASSGKVAAWRDGRGIAKSNKIDADLLGELWNEKPTPRRGVMRRWWEVWLAPQEVRDQRELLRHRMALVQAQTQVKNRIHATLHRHGVIIELTDLFGVGGRRFLSLLSEDKTLRVSGRQTLKEDLILLDALRRLIARATRRFRLTMQRSDTGQRLTTLPGVSTVLGYTLLAEIGRIERFASCRSLLQYSLLAPQANDSGEERDGKPIGRRIGHAGRTTLQWAFIQAAHSAVRKDKFFRDLFNRRTHGGKQDRGRGYITVANRMCRIAYALWKRQQDYQEVPPPRPGSHRHQELISSGSGPALARIGHELEAVQA
ncbi:MAG: IS110 family transposase [Tepidisphaeraceae bacterium]